MQSGAICGFQLDKGKSNHIKWFGEKSSPADNSRPPAGHLIITPERPGRYGRYTAACPTGKLVL